MEDPYPKWRECPCLPRVCCFAPVKDCLLVQAAGKIDVGNKVVEIEEADKAIMAIIQG